MKKNLLHIALASTLGLSSLPAFSADGTLGATSEGSSILTLDILDEVLITGLGDIPITKTGFGALATGSGTEPGGFCVYTNSSTGNYEITATSDATDSNANFQLVGPSPTDTIDYSVAVGGVNLVAGAISTSDFAGSSNSTCAGDTPQTLEITIAAGDLQDKATGTYTDTLVLTVSPD